jgi:myo-inositol-1(or 4)-monophosphatase
VTASSDAEPRHDPKPILEGSAPAVGVSAYARELTFALDVAERAGELLMDRYERVERISYKSARDVVTEVDEQSEELILAAIRAAFPADAILAEESGEHHGRRRGAAGGDGIAPSNGRTWIVDPVDGTINYANGIPFFCVSIGLVVNGVPVAGAVVDPSRSERFAATVDGPATLNGRVIAASDKERLSDFVISMALAGRAVASRNRAVRKQIRISRSMGSAALSLAYVGTGRFDAFIQSAGLSAWDIAAAGLIAERGGARVTDVAGGAWFDPARGPKTAGVLAAPTAHYGRLLELIHT